MLTKTNSPRTTYDHMKHEWKMNAEEGKFLRGYEVKFRNNARRLEGKNFTDAAERNRDRRAYSYHDRMLVRGNQRYLGLARAFHKGRPYSQAEYKPRVGNEVNVSRLMSELNYWGIEVTYEVLDEWVA